MMNTAHDDGVLEVVRAGIDTYQEPVVYMRGDCSVCRSEGFEAQARIKVTVGDRSIIATLNVVSGDWLKPHQAGLSESAWQKLRPEAGASASMTHPEPVSSMNRIRAKIYGERLVHADYLEIMRDCVAGRLADIELAAFLTACASRELDVQETVALTRAMVDVGARLDWGPGVVLDKHCVGGLPGNRTTPIVVAIVAACGYRIPKTSSRAITSPAGTADTMETLAPVELALPQMRKVVEQEGGCIVWGGSVALSPADDVLIRVERPLDFDGAAQLVASVLSKKVAAGATHVLLDLPVGVTAKLRSEPMARMLGERLQTVAGHFGLKAAIHISEGSQPIGRGIGPALEARDVLAVLARSPDAPIDLRERALDVAGTLLDLASGQPYWDVEHTYADSGSLYGRHQLYRAFLTLTAGRTDMRIGRQRIAWGTGRFWSPLDILNPFSPIQIEREERIGVDAALIEYEVGALSRLGAVYAPQHDSRDSSGALIWHDNRFGMDYSIMAGRFGHERVVGADVATQLGNAGLHGELTQARREDGTRYARVLLGLDYAFANTLSLGGELYYNGAGASDRSAYDFASLFAGRIQNVGRRYAGAYASFELTPLLKWTNYFVANLSDQSTFFSPSLTYSLHSNLDLTLGLQCLQGRPDTEYGRLNDTYYAQVQWFF